jgi:hypothetical protein
MVPADVSGCTVTNDALLVQLGRLVQSPAISKNAVSGFQAAINVTTKGVDVSFRLADITGISNVSLYRNFVFDPATASVIQTWIPSVSDYKWSDTDTAIQQQDLAYYWLLLSPQGTTGQPVQVGPQQISLNPDTVVPVPATGISASHGPVVNGKVTVTVNVSFTSPSVKIYIQGYHGNTTFVAVAQSSSSPIQFTLDATGETVTLKAIGVSAGGAEAASGPITTITLSGSATVPAQVQGVTVSQLSTGNQISFPASKDAGPDYKIYRGQRGDGFPFATLLATVTSTASTVVYLDTNGLDGDYEYYVVASNTAGDSNPSDAAFPPRVYSSAVLPPNSAGSVTNNAIIDSVNSGGSALVRIYGPSGVGTSYTHYAGYGSSTRPNGTVSGLSLKTAYAVVYDTKTSAYMAYLMTDYPSTLPDDFEFVGYYTTISSGAAPGSGATATAVIDASGHVIQINVDLHGSDYDAAEVDISGGGGSDAQAHANLSLFGGGVDSITVDNGGNSYTTVPTVTIVAIDPGSSTGGGGSSPIFVGGARYNSNPSTFKG